jgi:hypothetical protein
MHDKTRLFAIAVLLVGSSDVAAGTAALPSVADTTLIESPAGEVSNGSGPEMRAGLIGAGLSMRGAIRFDVAGSIPAGVTIDSATLILYSSGGGQSTPRRIDVHRLLAEWGEGGSIAFGGQGAPSAPGDATWLHRFYNPAAPGDSPAWNLPGGDFVDASGAASDVAGSGYFSWSSAGLVDDVQLWLVSPGENHGWLLIGDETASQSAKKFGTREAELEAHRPALLIEYSTSGQDGDEDEDEDDDRPLPRGRHGYNIEMGPAGSR